MRKEREAKKKYELIDSMKDKLLKNKSRRNEMVTMGKENHKENIKREKSKTRAIPIDV